jgi:hypothetical protein
MFSFGADIRDITTDFIPPRIDTREVYFIVSVFLILPG